jgi:hypothetical protein
MILAKDGMGDSITEMPSNLVLTLLRIALLR